MAGKSLRGKGGGTSLRGSGGRSLRGGRDEGDDSILGKIGRVVTTPQRAVLDWIEDEPDPDAPPSFMRQWLNVAEGLPSGLWELGEDVVGSGTAYPRLLGDVVQGNMPWERSWYANAQRYAPLSVSLGQSFRRTGEAAYDVQALAPGGRKPTETRYAQASRDGELLGRILEDVGNVALVGTVASGGATLAAGRSAQAAGMGGRAAEMGVARAGLRGAARGPVLRRVLGDAHLAERSALERLGPGARRGIAQRTARAAAEGQPAARITPEMIGGRARWTQHLPSAPAAERAAAWADTAARLRQFGRLGDRVADTPAAPFRFAGRKAVQAAPIARDAVTRIPRVGPWLSETAGKATGAAVRFGERRNLSAEVYERGQRRSVEMGTGVVRAGRRQIEAAGGDEALADAAQVERFGAARAVIDDVEKAAPAYAELNGMDLDTARATMLRAAIPGVAPESVDAAVRYMRGELDEGTTAAVAAAAAAGREGIGRPHRKRYIEGFGDADTPTAEQTRLRLAQEGRDPIDVFEERARARFKSRIDADAEATVDAYERMRKADTRRKVPAEEYDAALTPVIEKAYQGAIDASAEVVRADPSGTKAALGLADEVSDDVATTTLADRIFRKRTPEGLREALEGADEGARRLDLPSTARLDPVEDIGRRAGEAREAQRAAARERRYLEQASQQRARQAGREDAAAAAVEKAKPLEPYEQRLMQGNVTFRSTAHGVPAAFNEAGIPSFAEWVDDAGNPTEVLYGETYAFEPPPGEVTMFDTMRRVVGEHRAKYDERLQMADVAEARVRAGDSIADLADNEDRLLRVTQNADGDVLVGGQTKQRLTNARDDFKDYEGALDKLEPKVRAAAATAEAAPPPALSGAIPEQLRERARRASQASRSRRHELGPTEAAEPVIRDVERGRVRRDEAVTDRERRRSIAEEARERAARRPRQEAERRLQEQERRAASGRRVRPVPRNRAEAARAVREVRQEVKQVARDVGADVAYEMSRLFGGERLPYVPAMRRGESQAAWSARTGLDAASYEWFFDLGKAERDRIRRNWMHKPGEEGGMAPDVLGANFAAHRRGSGEFTSAMEEQPGAATSAMDEWLRLTREADAAQRLASGRQGFQRGAGTELDIDTIGHHLVSKGFDVDEVLSAHGSDLRTAADALVERRQQAARDRAEVGREVVEDPWDEYRISRADRDLQRLADDADAWEVFDEAEADALEAMGVGQPGNVHWAEAVGYKLRGETIPFGRERLERLQRDVSELRDLADAGDITPEEVLYQRWASDQLDALDPDVVAQRDLSIVELRVADAFARNDRASLTTRVERQLFDDLASDDKLRQASEALDDRRAAAVDALVERGRRAGERAGKREGRSEGRLAERERSTARAEGRAETTAGRAGKVEDFDSLGATWRDAKKQAAAIKRFDALPDQAVVRVYRGVPAEGTPALASEPGLTYVAPTRADAEVYAGREGGRVESYTVRKGDLRNPREASPNTSVGHNFMHSHTGVVLAEGADRAVKATTEGARLVSDPGVMAGLLARPIRQARKTGQAEGIARLRETEYRRAQRREATTHAAEERAGQKARTSPRANPASFAEASRARGNLRNHLRETADKLDEMAELEGLPVGSAEVLRHIIDEADLSVLNLREVMGDFQPESARGVEMGRVHGATSRLDVRRARSRKTSNERYKTRTEGASDLTVRGQVRAEISLVSDQVHNELFKWFGDTYGKSAADVIGELEASRLRGDDLVDAMDEAGFVPYDPRMLMTQPAGRTAGPGTRWVRRDLRDTVLEQAGKAPGKVERALEQYWDRKVMGSIRTWWLALSPRWLVGNVVGNMVLATVGGGVNPLMLPFLMREASKMRKAEQLPNRLFGRGFMAPDAEFLAHELDIGLNPDEATRFELFKQDARDASWRSKGAWRKAALLPEFSYRANNFVDEITRGAIYLDKVGKGLSPDQAIRSALNAAGDFSKMTKFERQVMRRLLPFYSWARHITVLAFKLPIYHPLRVVWTAHLINIFGNDEEQHTLPPELRGAIKFGDTYIGTGTLNPFGDVERSPLVSPTGFMGSMSPLVGWPLAVLGGYDVRDMSSLARPAGFEELDEYGRPKATPLISRPAELAYYMSQQFPQGRLAMGLRAGSEVRYETGYPVVSGGDVMRSHRGRLNTTTRFLTGVSPPAGPEVVEDYRERVAERKEEQGRSRRRYLSDVNG